MPRHDVRCTDKELEAWKVAAVREGTTVGGLIKRLMNQFSGYGEKGDGRRFKKGGRTADDGSRAASAQRGAFVDTGEPITKEEFVEKARAAPPVEKVPLVQGPARAQLPWPEHEEFHGEKCNRCVRLCTGPCPNCPCYEKWIKWRDAGSKRVRKAGAAISSTSGDAGGLPDGVELSGEGGGRRGGEERAGDSVEVSGEVHGADGGPRGGVVKGGDGGSGDGGGAVEGDDSRFRGRWGPD